MKRLQWIAEADKVAHAVDRRGHSLCGEQGMDTRYGWPAIMRCRDCLYALHLATGTPLAALDLPAALTDGVGGAGRPAQHPGRPSGHPAIARAVARATADRKEGDA
jgi:hypothetical protein